MRVKAATDVDPVHPGEVLGAEFLAPLGLSAAALARRLGVPAKRVREIVAGRRSVTGDTALRLAAALGTSAEFWMNLQKGWKLAVARREWKGGVERVARIIFPATRCHSCALQRCRGF